MYLIIKFTLSLIETQTVGQYFFEFRQFDSLTETNINSNSSFINIILKVPGKQFTIIRVYVDNNEKLILWCDECHGNLLI